MNSKVVTVSVFGAIIVVVISLLAFSNSAMQEAQEKSGQVEVFEQNDEKDKFGDEEEIQNNPVTGEGVYTEYDKSRVGLEGYHSSIIFFHAPWCPQCVAFERDFKDKDIPKGVQILKADYDTATELKERYGVTLQTTFVLVGDDGELMRRWVGYSEEKTLETVLEAMGI